MKRQVDVLSLLGGPEIMSTVDTNRARSYRQIDTARLRPRSRSHVRLQEGTTQRHSDDARAPLHSVGSGQVPAAVISTEAAERPGRDDAELSALAVTSAPDSTAFLGGALHASAAVAAGVCDMAVAIRVIQRVGSSGLPPPDRVAGDSQFLAPFGAGQPAQWAGMYMQRMMSEFGWDEQAFGNQMVTRRRYAAMNPDAFQRDPVTIDDYLPSRYVRAPLRLFDCDYRIDASGAVVLHDGGARTRSQAEAGLRGGGSL